MEVRVGLRRVAGSYDGQVHKLARVCMCCMCVRVFSYQQWEMSSTKLSNIQLARVGLLHVTCQLNFFMLTSSGSLSRLKSCGKYVCVFVCIFRDCIVFFKVKGQLLVEQYPATVRDMTDIARGSLPGH